MGGCPLLMACICAVSFYSSFASASDSQLLEILNRAVGFIDDPDGGPGEVRYAIEASGYDTNRVVSLMKQLIAEGARRTGSTRFYLLEIGKYGTSADLPFLYQKVSETNFWVLSQCCGWD